MASPKKTKKASLKGWNELEILAFLAFLIWSAAGLYFTIEHVTPKVIGHWGLPPWLTHFVELCLKYGDPVLIVLAFANSHLHAANQWSAPVARNWAVIVVMLSFGVEALGVHTGFPFGEYHYTDNFGTRLYEVPLVIPLAWHVVITNALFIIRAVEPYISQFLEAAAVGAICTAYDYILEPFATSVRHYWDWSSGSVAELNYPAWFLISAILVFIFAPTYTSRRRWTVRPWAVLGLTVAIFEAGRWAAGLPLY